MTSSRVPLPVKVLACAIVLQALIVFCYSVTRVYMLAGAVLDIGVYMQVLHAIVAYGKPVWTLTLLGQGEQNWLGFHFTPLLYLLAPFYALFPSPIFLDAVHASAISLAAIPVYLAARSLGLERKHACVAGLAYLFNPFTLNAGVWGFQESCLAAPFMAIALWGLAARRFRLVVIGASLLLLTKEHYGVSVMMMGFLWWKLYGDKRRGLMLGAAGMATLLLVILVIMPYFSGRYAHPMFTSAFAERYGWILSPNLWGKVIPILASEDLQYITLLLGVFCFLPLAGAWWLLPGAADFVVTSLSEASFTRNLFSYYSLPLTPILVLAACAGYMRLRPWLQSRLLAVGMSCTVLLAYVYLAALPLPLSSNWPELPVIPKFSLSPSDAEAVRNINAMVPPDIPLTVQIHIGMFFIRRDLQIVPYSRKQVIDDAVLYLDSPWKISPIMPCPGLYNYWTVIKKTLEDPAVKIIYWQKPWLLLSRREYAKDIPAAHAPVKEAFEQFMNGQYQLCRIWNGG